MKIRCFLAAMLAVLLLSSPGRAQEGPEQWVKVEDVATSSLAVLSLAYTPHHHAFDNGPLLLAGTRGQGIWLSTDGAHWVPAGLEGLTISTLAIAPDGTIYAGEGEKYPPTTYRDQGIHRSDDGRHWEVKANGLANQGVVEYISGLAVNSQGHVYTSANDKLFLSTNRGESWQKGGNAIHNVSTITVVDDDRVFVGYYDLYPTRILEITSDGQSIIRAWDLPPYHHVNALVQEPGATYLFAGVDGGLSREGVQNFYRSEGGQSWDAGPVLGEKIQIEDGEGYPSVWRLVIRPLGDLFAVMAGSSLVKPVLRSTNRGLTWEGASEGLTGIVIASIVSTSDGTLYVGTVGHGIYRSTWRVPVEVSSFQAD